MKTIDILTIGEPLVEFAEVERAGERLYLPGHGGDVSNTAVAAARQGAKAAIFTALGGDSFGADFLKLWDLEGVDRSSVVVRPEGRTGAYFISYGKDGHVFSYARAGSAASLVQVNELPLRQIASSRILHASGISQAISDSCADSVFAAIRHARESGTTISYDTNLRLRLWPLDRARAVIHGAVALSDIALPGLDDAQQLTGLERPEDICGFYLTLGCQMVALTMGKSGTMVAVGERREVMPARPVEAVDATGAGDTFDGAFLSEWLVDGDPFRAAAYANAAAALSTLGRGAVAPMPTRAETEAFMRT
ncbi:sugar kinase [Microvirga brassicacearum]|uniref:Sugar kinase n=1 Tax=Microvirga brassicacearum TaxID=2580413 RepID=A0A5N3P2T1_9HYPH|nr:sugar kinase [Microvirga brassicacearum]KAB0264087.1 sugar kinase [Microvirga brassicacearum]